MEKLLLRKGLKKDLLKVRIVGCGKRASILYE